MTWGALLNNASTRVCHLLDDGEDVDLILRFMLNRLEADRFVTDIRTLHLGGALLQVSSPATIGPSKVKVQAQPDQRLDSAFGFESGGSVWKSTANLTRGADEPI